MSKGQNLPDNQIKTESRINLINDQCMGEKKTQIIKISQISEKHVQALFHGDGYFGNW